MNTKENCVQITYENKKPIHYICGAPNVEMPLNYSHIKFM